MGDVIFQLVHHAKENSRKGHLYLSLAGGRKTLAPFARDLRTRFTGLSEPLAVCGFLLSFEQHADRLEQYIYADLLQPGHFTAIGIDRYEALGDLQGSGLLQHEKTIRAAARVLIRQTRENNICYLELRCSPCNYTRGGLTSRQVVDYLIDELERDPDCHYRLLFIASRHGKMSRVYEHIELAQDLLSDKQGQQWLAGFDLAGAEHEKSPQSMRAAFLPLMQRCLSFTIHAGENEKVENIWQAVYHLNAERIGHGLTLNDNPELLNHFLQRRIAIEMCPSSNRQIVGFSKENTYPLGGYLAKGLRVTINTDDPGISRTDLTQEYLLAAQMTANGLSQWDILILIRNSLKAAFSNYKSTLIQQAEKQISQLLLN